TPFGISLSPTDWKTAYVVDSRRVFLTTDAGATFVEITGNLGSALGVSQLQSITLVPGIGTTSVLVGTDIGVFVADANRLGCPPGGGSPCSTVWSPFGTLVPRTYAFNLVYTNSNNADTLIVGTLGRGSFKLTEASKIVAGSNHLFGAAP